MLPQEQTDDDDKKAYCEKEFDSSEDQIKASHLERICTRRNHRFHAKHILFRLGREWPVLASA
eukprot:1918579-Amphidinium_carterae.1